MHHHQALCQTSSEGISNPICAYCYFNEIRVWIQDADLPLFQKRKVLIKINEILKRESTNPDTCIICGNEGLALCSYCFFFKATRILKSAGVKRGDLKKFLELFSYTQFYDTYPFALPS